MPTPNGHGHTTNYREVATKAELAHDRDPVESDSRSVHKGQVNPTELEGSRPTTEFTAEATRKLKVTRSAMDDDQQGYIPYCQAAGDPEPHDTSRIESA